MERPKCNAWAADTDGAACLRPAHHFYTLDGALDPVILFGRCEAHRELGQGTEGPELWREVSAAEMAALEVHGS